MTRSFSFILILASCLLLSWQTTLANTPSLKADPNEYRVALVIGNSDYDQAPLLSPVNDARAMTASLQDAGFHVINLENASAAQMAVALREFGDTLRQVGGVGLFYYAGHGVQLEGENYLVPVDTDIQRAHEIKYQSLNLNQVLDELGEAQNRLNIVILDACRNNPFPRSSRSLQNGLAPVNYSSTPSGTFIAFATGPGQVAVDGDDYGLFTKHLLANMTTPGLPIEQVFKRVRANVMAETDGFQVPWENSSLTGDFFFKTKSVESPVETPTQNQEPLVTAKAEPLAEQPESTPSRLIKLTPQQLQLVAPKSAAASTASSKPLTLDQLLDQAQQQLAEGRFKAAQQSLDKAFTHYQSASLEQLRAMTDLTQALTTQMLGHLQNQN